jgi:hypothetical protein
VGLVAALTAALAARERSSVRATAVIVAGGVIIVALLSRAVPALAFLAELAWWIPPALITAAAALLVAFMPLLILPRPVIDAWTTLTHLALAGRRRWREHGGPLPEAHELDDWLLRHAEPEDAMRRAEALASHGRLDEVQLPDADATAPSERFIRGQVAWFAAFAMGDETVARAERLELDAMLAEMPDGADRDESRAALRVIDAVRAMAEGADWVGPLAAARGDLGSAADGVVIRWLVLPRFKYYGRISGLIFVGTLLLNVLLESVLG